MMPELQEWQSGQQQDPEEGMVVVVVEDVAMDHNCTETVTIKTDTSQPPVKCEMCEVVVEESSLPGEGEDQDGEEIIHEVQGRLEGCRFMAVSRVVKLLTESRWALESVPPGLKEYVYFVVNNESNMQRRSNKKRSDFPDDCGVWLSGSGSTPRTTFMVTTTGELKQVFLREGRYYIERVTHHRKECLPVVPQPPPDRLLELHRYYVALKMDKSYRKRVSWLGPGGCGGHPSLAVVEYIGKFPGFSPHGKASGEHEYVRPAPSLKEDMSVLLRDGLSPREVHQELLQRYERLHGLRDVRQVRDTRLRFRQQQQQVITPHPYNLNSTVDCLVHLVEMVQEGDCLVRAAWHLPDRSACVALYTDEQLRDLRNLCLTGQTLLVVDRSLAVCGLTATITGYRQLALARQGGQPPVFLGPVLLHKGSDLEEYAAFLSHLKVRIGQVDTSQLVVGTEDIPALKQAVQLTLPGAAHTLLTAHLSSTITDWLKNDGLAESDIQTVVDQVVGPDGLLGVTNTAFLQDLSDILLQDWGSLAPGFSVYLKTQLMPLLQDKVEEPPQVRELEKMWTNSPEDCVSHQLSQAIDWNSRSLMDFVEKVRQVAESQFEELRSAMLGEGPLCLSSAVVQFRASRAAWETMNRQQQEEAYERLRDYVWGGKTEAVPVEKMQRTLLTNTEPSSPLQESREPSPPLDEREHSPMSHTAPTTSSPSKQITHKHTQKRRVSPPTCTSHTTTSKKKK